MLLGDRELSVTEMMELLDLSDRKHFREMYLEPAIATGMVEMTIPEKPKSSKQKYRRVRK